MIELEFNFSLFGSYILTENHYFFSFREKILDEYYECSYYGSSVSTKSLLFNYQVNLSYCFAIFSYLR